MTENQNLSNAEKELRTGIANDLDQKAADLREDAQELRDQAAKLDEMAAAEEAVADDLLDELNPELVEGNPVEAPEALSTVDDLPVFGSVETPNDTLPEEELPFEDEAAVLEPAANDEFPEDTDAKEQQEEEEL